jgi:hypothetical protein
LSRLPACTRRMACVPAAEALVRQRGPRCRGCPCIWTCASPTSGSNARAAAGGRFAVCWLVSLVVSASGSVALPPPLHVWAAGGLRPYAQLMRTHTRASVPGGDLGKIQGFEKGMGAEPLDLNAQVCTSVVCWSAACMCVCAGARVRVSVCVWRVGWVRAREASGMHWARISVYMKAALTQYLCVGSQYGGLKIEVWTNQPRVLGLQRCHSVPQSLSPFPS